MSDIAANLRQVRDDIAHACRDAGRDPASVTLVAVSKFHPAEAIVDAWEAGQRDFGENYAQDFAARREELRLRCPGIRFHFIGPLQSNKAKLVAGRAALVHTADRVKILRHLSRLAEEAGTVQEILFELHLSPEESKAGCHPDDLDALVEQALELPGIRPRGLMTMPPWDLEAEAARPYFVRLRQLRDRVRDRFALPHFDQLSMGMSHDFAVAIAEGATIVRVGTAIFGARTP